MKYISIDRKKSPALHLCPVASCAVSRSVGWVAGVWVLSGWIIGSVLQVRWAAGRPHDTLNDDNDILIFYVYMCGPLQERIFRNCLKNIIWDGRLPDMELWFVIVRFWWAYNISVIVFTSFGNIIYEFKDTRCSSSIFHKIEYIILYFDLNMFK